jgi:glycosyltransferase involved in cell wall biosynthesis
MANLRLFGRVRGDPAVVVHCNDLNALWRGALGARLAGAPVVWSIRAMLNVGGFKWRLGRALADVIVVMSSEMRSQVEAQVPPLPWPSSRAAAVSVIPSIVELDTMTPPSPGERRALREKLGITADELAVGVIGAVIPRKQQLPLLEALARDGERIPDARFYFVGDLSAGDPYGMRCVAAAEHPKVRDRVRLVGYSPAVTDWYRALDVTVVASTDEGLCRAMIESLACGTPVVSFPVCSAREILVGHEAGIVVEGDDFGALFEAIARIGEDAALRGRLAEAGARAARALFGAQGVMSEYTRLYGHLVGDARR